MIRIYTNPILRTIKSNFNACYNLSTDYFVVISETRTFNHTHSMISVESLTVTLTLLNTDIPASNKQCPITG